MDIRDFLRTTGRREGFRGIEELKGLNELLGTAMGGDTMPDNLEEFLKSKGLVLERKRKTPELIFAEAQAAGKESEIDHFKMVVLSMHEELAGLSKKLTETDRMLKTKEGLLDEYKNKSVRLSERIEKLAVQNTRLAEQIGELSKAKLKTKLDRLGQKMRTMHAMKGKILSMIGGNGKDPSVILKDINDLLLDINAKPDEKLVSMAPGGDAVEQASQTAEPAQGAAAP